MHFGRVGAVGVGAELGVDGDLPGVVGYIVAHYVGVSADGTHILQVVAFVDVPRAHGIVFLFIRNAHFHLRHIAQGEATGGVGLHFLHSVFARVARRHGAAIHRNFHLLNVQCTCGVFHFNEIVVGACLVAAISGGSQEIVVDNDFVVDATRRGERILVEAQGSVHRHRTFVGERVGEVFAVHIEGSNFSHLTAICFFAIHHAFGRDGAIVFIRREADGIFVGVLV